MKCIDVSMFEVNVVEAFQLKEKTPVLIYDTLLQNFKLVKASGLAPWNDPLFDDKRYVLLLFTQPIYKINIGTGGKRNE